MQKRAMASRCGLEGDAAQCIKPHTMKRFQVSIGAVPQSNVLFRAGLGWVTHQLVTTFNEFLPMLPNASNRTQ